MATFTVWKFNTPTGAEQATKVLDDLSRQNLITIHDAATVSWDEGKNKPGPTSSRAPRARVRWAGRSGACCSD